MAGIRRFVHGAAIALVTFITLVVIPAAASCRHASQADRAAFTHVDRLVSHYAALGDGRFAVVADFEDPAHGSLFRVESASGAGTCAVDHEAAFRPTGGAGLRVKTASAGDTLLIETGESADWFLIRDWRDYDLLLLNVRPNAPAATLSVEIAAGRGEKRRTAVAMALLGKGWNELNLDLGDVGERIPLDDIRDLRVRLERSGGEPAGFDIDDILVTRSRSRLMGDERNREGRLYVLQRGRRLHVGAGGSFELVFSQGQTVGWYDLRSDPDRLHNLAGGTLIQLRSNPNEAEGSPETLHLHTAGNEKGPVAPASSGVFQRLLEATPVRAIVTCEVAGIEKYTIYPSGHVVVRAQPVAASNEINEPWWVAALARPGDWEAVVSPPAASAGESAPARRPAYAAARRRSAPSCALALVTPETSGTASPSCAIRPDRPLDLIVPGDSSLACLVRLGPAEGDWPGWVDELSLSYAEPPPMMVQIGRTIGGDAEPAMLNGYDRAGGCYRVRPDVEVVRLELDGRTRPIECPAFQIAHAPAGPAWVYVNHWLLPNVSRETDQSLVFQIPGVIRERTLIEVLIRAEERDGGG